ncbi:MAG: hypothetical protein OEZ01_02960 [Candidatus Heimdallarchaeota archaeon]|nr:hypothetical protein [Candidatus Heimdallarchaeota archaeon]MDH5644938.1 hypothetical protein [Candidatus Heimdallarchaeota archaeon]
MTNGIEFTIINGFNILINGSIFAYFSLKLRRLYERITLYWFLAYFIFFISNIISLYHYFTFQNIDQAFSVVRPISLFAVMFLSLSVLEMGLINLKKDILSMIFGMMGILSLISQIFSLFTYIYRISIIIYSLVAFLGYIFIAIKSRNYPLLQISLGILIQAVAGFLSATEIIGVVFAYFILALGAFFIGFGIILGKYFLENNDLD